MKISPRIEKCSFCAKDMEFEVRVPSLKALGQVHYFFSCECGRVASQAETEVEQVGGGAQKIADEVFRSWAVRINLTSGWGKNKSLRGAPCG